VPEALDHCAVCNTIRDTMTSDVLQQPAPRSMAFESRG
jgi:hypothetical protein